MAIEMSKNHESPAAAREEEEELLRRALEASRRASQVAADEDERLLQEALRQSTLDFRSSPAVRSRVSRSFVPSFVRFVRSWRYVVFLQAVAASRVDDDYAPPLHQDAKAIEDSDLELTLHMSEQVQSLEDVLDADADEEQLRFALQASREHHQDEYKPTHFL